MQGKRMLWTSRRSVYKIVARILLIERLVELMSKRKKPNFKIVAWPFRSSKRSHLACNVMSLSMVPPPFYFSRVDLAKSIDLTRANCQFFLKCTDLYVAFATKEFHFLPAVALERFCYTESTLCSRVKRVILIWDFHGLTIIAFFRFAETKGKHINTYREPRVISSYAIVL